MIETILVIGGTGMLGEPVARRLHAEGFAVRLLARSPGKARARFGEAYEVVPGDVTDPVSIERALQGCQGVHVSLMGGPSPEAFDRIEHRGTAAVAQAAAKLGIQRLTFLSGAPVHPSNLHDPGTRAKHDAEEAIRASGVPYTIFRVTWMMETLEMFVRGKRALLLGRQAVPLRFIAAEDYAQMVARAYRLPEAANQTLLVVGPEPVSKADALATYCRVVRPELKLTQLPLGLMRVVAALSFDPQLRADVRRMGFYDRIGDDFGDPAPAEALLGKAETTLEAWCQGRREFARI